jgi:hypothetical protein
VDGGISDLSEDGNLPIANGSWLDHVDTGLGSGAGLLSNTSLRSQIVPSVVQTTVGIASGSSGAGTIGFMSDDGSTAPSLPHAVESADVPVVAAATIVGATIGQVTTNADGSFSESVSFAGSNIAFNNTFASGLSQAYINCALAAEQSIASNWSAIAPVTLNEAFTAQAEGQSNEPLASNNFYYVKVSYAALKGALDTLAVTAIASHEANPYLQQAVANLPASDPSNGAGFDLALPYARMLGFAAQVGVPEDTVTLNTSFGWNYGQDVINTLTHEISEGGMGRIGGLGTSSVNFWSLMDLFRYNASHVADYTNGRDGQTTYFSYNGGATLSGLSYNNQFNTLGQQLNGGDTADFTQVDVFGTGFPGETNMLSQTDIQIMEALGWMPPVQGPVVSASTAYLNSTSVAASSLFTVSDSNGLPITAYSFMDTGPGHFALNGVTESDNTEIDITAAQLSQLTYVSVPGMADTLQVRAEDSLAWGGWTSFGVIAPQVIVQVDTNSFGTTKLAEAGGQYALENSSGNGPHLVLNGAPVLVGQLSPWIPIGAAPTATGYEIAFKLGSSLFVWNTDRNGNYVSGSGALAATSTALETYETSFNQDLNGDGTIGVTSAVIETNGITSLVAVADQYALEDSHGNGPHLTINGAPVVAGQLAPWTPVAAAQTPTGYVVAFQLGNSFAIWNTDSNANYVSGTGSLSGTSTTLETYETVFHRDLNGDGTIGVTSTVIETNGTTSLVAVADQYALEDSHGNGPHLTINGAPVVAGQLAPWAPVAAAQTSSGYVVAFQLGNSFAIWNTDSNANYVSDTGSLSGTSTTLETYETVFHRDLNGDGTIGVTSTVIETNGITSLVAVADQYALEDSHGNGPHLKINGAPVVAGELAPWTPVAAAQTSSGYVVAFQLGNTFAIWNTDSNANYVSDTGSLSGTSATLENYETIFNHDLNGDGTIGVPPGGGAPAAVVAAATVQSSDNFTFHVAVSADTTVASSSSSASAGVIAAAAVSHPDSFSFLHFNQGAIEVASDMVAPPAAPAAAPVLPADGHSQNLNLDWIAGGSPEGGAHLTAPANMHLWHYDLSA